MKKAKIGVFALVVVIASAGMGISYAGFNGVPMSTEPTSSYGLIGIRAVSHGDSGFDQVHVGGTTYQSDKNVGVTSFVNNGNPSWYMYIGGGPVGFWNTTYPSPSLALNDVYPCYASNITVWFGNNGNTNAYILSATLEEINESYDLVIDDWVLKIDGAQVASGAGKTGLISTLQDNNVVVLGPGEYLSVIIEFHFDNAVPENILEELFEYKFVWWGPD